MLLCPFETEIVKNPLCVEKTASFLLTSPSYTPVCTGTYAHMCMLSYQKLGVNPVNMQMLKPLPLEWIEKTKGWQTASNSNILLYSLGNVCIVEETEAGKFSFVCF